MILILYIIIYHILHYHIIISYIIIYHISLYIIKRLLMWVLLTVGKFNSISYLNRFLHKLMRQSPPPQVASTNHEWLYDANHCTSFSNYPHDLRLLLIAICRNKDLLLELCNAKNTRSLKAHLEHSLQIRERRN